METFLEHLYKTWSELPPKSRVAGNMLLFERYQVEALLGVGGTSIVVSARDTNLERVVAIKIWNPHIGKYYWFDKGDDRKFYINEIDYFRREAQRLASLKHRNLCEVYDFGVNTDGIPWLVMELFDGVLLRGLLSQWASDSRQHTIEFVLLIFQQVVAAVDFLHRNGLYQLDIKPENILVSGNSVKLIDIASGLERPADKYKIKHARYGTPGYVAPEIVNSLNRNDITPAADVFSLGATLLEMCCLQNPLASEVLRKAAYEALGIVERDVFLDYSTAAFYPDWNSKIERWGETYTNELVQLDIRATLHSSPIRVPQTITELVTRMMALNFTDRPRNAGEVLKELFKSTTGDISVTARTTILFLAADPTDASRLRLGHELREIQEKLQLARMRDEFRLAQRMSVRPVDISQAILDEKPRIVHFSGHGTSEGSLCFENEMGESIFVEPEALSALFELVSHDVDCVLLNACYSEAQARAIANHIKYVIGMNKTIGDTAAISFAVGFYKALGAGKPIVEAYKFGCVEIRLQGIPEYLTPILITR